MTDTGDELLNMAELGAFYGLTEVAMRVRRHRGWAPPMKVVEGRLYISRTDLNAWTAEYGKDLPSIKRRRAADKYAATPIHS